MPSLEMRRSTRIFVPPMAKDGELVKVLRSGRRLWVDSATEINQQNDLKWLQSIENRSDFKWERLNQIAKDCRNDKVNVDLMEVDGGNCDQEPEKTGESFGNVCRSEGRVIRNVYCRKRKRISDVCETRRFGVYFVRRKRRKCVASTMETSSGGGIKVFSGIDDFFSIVIESYCAGCSFVSRVLSSVLKHLRNGGEGFAQILAFLVSSSPVTKVFASFGIHFLLNLQRTENRGVCRISWERLEVPLLVVDFSAIPLYFLGLHVALSLRSACLFWLNWSNPHDGNSSVDDDVETATPTDGSIEQIPSSPIAPCRNCRGIKIVVSGLEAGKTGSRNGHIKSGVLTRSASRSGRRSLRNRRARNPLNFVLQKPNGLPGSNHCAFNKNGVQLSLRRSARKNPASEINVPKSTLCSTTNVPKPNPCSMINVPKSNSNSNSVGLNLDIDSKQCCSVNILVVETDKCYRIEGAEVVLVLTDSNEWVMAVRKDGKSTYHFRVQKEIRPSTVNRFTHAVVWAAENGWKFEFPDRKDWVVFKELNKSCEERNVVPSSRVVKIIPVPGVSEVANFLDSIRPFERPESYIRTTSDELSRMLSRTATSYDMDLQDEQWLSKFNSELDKANVLSEKTFELMIYVFEKSSYCSPVDLNDEEMAVSVCLNLASPEVSIHVYRYWVEKRKQRCAPLLRVFELNEQKRSPLNAKPVLRKKRSLKRTPHPPQRGRGKDDSRLKALDLDRTSREEQLPVLDIQEAKSSADKSVEVAILKRQRAQFLMENADLAVYRAAMALRIADAAIQAVDLQQAADHFLD